MSSASQPACGPASAMAAAGVRNQAPRGSSEGHSECHGLPHAAQAGAPPPGVSLSPKDYVYAMPPPAQQMQLYQHYMAFQHFMAFTAAATCFPGPWPVPPCAPMPPAGFYAPSCAGFYPMPMPMPHAMHVPDQAKAAAASSAPAVSQQATKVTDACKASQQASKANQGQSAFAAAAGSKVSKGLKEDPLMPLDAEDIRRLFEDDVDLDASPDFSHASDGSTATRQQPFSRAPSSSSPVLGKDAVFDDFDMPMTLIAARGSGHSDGASRPPASKPTVQLKIKGGVQKQKAPKASAAAAPAKAAAAPKQQQAAHADGQLDPLIAYNALTAMLADDDCGMSWDTGLTLADMELTAF